MCMNCTRGDIFFADLSPVIGSEQGGRRPVVIIQNNIGNQHSPTVIVAAVTSHTSTKARLPVHVELPDNVGLEKNCIALMEQIRTIDKSRLKNYVGKLDETTMHRLDKSLGISVGLLHKVDWSKGIELCLCRRCATDFFTTPGHYIKRKNRNETVKDTCTYCNGRHGFDYLII